MSKIRILDCTLRDGGYKNNWQFKVNNIKGIINDLNKTGVDIVECGFLKDKDKYEKDITIFRKVNDVKNITNNRLTEYVCMINYGEYDLKNLDEYNKSCIVKGIRVAFKKKDMKNALAYCKRIIEKGYRVYIQPMVTIDYSEEELRYLIKEVNSMKAYSLYIVDSFGNIQQRDAIRIFNIINKYLDKDIYIGFHGHNNLQLAYSNAVQLIEICNDRNVIVDSTIHGIGRGVGNLNTELILSYLNCKFVDKYKIEYIIHAANSYINEIYIKEQWGYSLPYFFTAMNGCHPNYATFLCDKDNLSSEDINDIIKNIVDIEKNKYNKNYISKLYKEYVGEK